MMNSAQQAAAEVKRSIANKESTRNRRCEMPIVASLALKDSLDGLLQLFLMHVF
jgi:hypothetical protein